MWIWKRKPVHDPGAERAQQALARAKEQTAEVKSRWPTIRAVVQDLEAMRKENNFAARIRAAYGEGR